MINAATYDRGRGVRQILLMPAVVVVLMTAAAPAGASLVTSPMGIAGSARTAAIAKEHPHSSRHRSPGWQAVGRKGRELGRKVGLSRY